MTQNLFDLSGKKVLVTGGNGGIGLGMADALARAGATLAIWGRNAHKNAAAASRIAAFGGDIRTAVVDVSDRRAIVDAMENCVADLGGLDAVIANAGTSTAARSFIDISDDDYDRVLAVNLDGLAFTLREAAKHMVQQYERDAAFKGSLIAVSSLGAIKGIPANQHYAASKGAAVSVTLSCAVEYARYGIRANAILPGFTYTDMTSGYLGSAKTAEKVLPRIPARRWGKPEDFGGVAVYLVSDASEYQTGSTLIIDGGYSIF